MLDYLIDLNLYIWNCIGIIVGGGFLLTIIVSIISSILVLITAGINYGNRK